MAGTRYDIAFTTTKLAKFCNNPGTNHFEAFFWLLGYIKKTMNFGIRYYHDMKSSPLGELLRRNNMEYEGEALTFSDSTWQDCIDTGQSTGSYMTFCQGGLIDYSSFVPDPIVMSSREAEYNTCAVATMASLTN